MKMDNEELLMNVSGYREEKTPETNSSFMAEM